MQHPGPENSRLILPDADTSHLLFASALPDGRKEGLQEQLINRESRRLIELLEHDRNFDERHLSHDEHPGYVVRLDAVYKEDVLAETRRAYIEDRVRGVPRDAAIGEAVERAREWRPQFAQLWKQCRGLPVITVLGSARDQVWHPELEELSTQIAQGAVQRGISLINGGGPAVMERLSSFWQSSIGKEGNNEARVILVPLRVESEPLNTFGSKGHISRPMTCLMNRTPALFLLGEQLLSLYYPGGLGTLEEAAHNLAQMQLTGIAETWYTHRPSLAPSYFLNSELRPGMPFFRNFYDQLKVMEHSGAVDQKIFEKIVLLETANPAAAATVLIDECERRLQELAEAKKNA